MKKLITLLCLFPLLVIAQIPQPQAGTYVNDLAGVLAATSIQQINERLDAIQKAYAVQIAVVLVNDLPTGMEIEDYAREIGRQWHVGNHDNGLVYVASINQHKQRLEVARNLEGTITDIAAREITDHIKPFFRAKDYAGGILNMLQDIDQRLQPVQAEQQGLNKRGERGLPGWAIILICLTGAGALAILIWLITRKEKLADQEKDQGPDWERIRAKAATASPPAPRATDSRNTTIIAPIITNNHYGDRIDDSPSYGSSPSSSSYDSGSSSSSFGGFSSDSGGSSSFDSGFSGGGSSNDW